MRVALIIAYNGANFLGSQQQKSSSNTILGNLNIVLEALGIQSKIVASGRTDKGVHATGQVCHIDLPDFWVDLKKLKRVLNEMLISSIKVKKILKVTDDFHARYDAKKRVYRYILKDGDSNPFYDDFITFEKNINFENLQNKIKLFEGKHDFRYYMKLGSDTKSSVRVIYKAFAYRYKDFIVLYFEANGFLRTQIRFMVGAILNFDEYQITSQLDLQKKHSLKPAKCNGLYLAKIKY